MPAAQSGRAAKRDGNAVQGTETESQLGVISEEFACFVQRLSLEPLPIPLLDRVSGSMLLSWSDLSSKHSAIMSRSREISPCRW